jgi:hypothetical protein
LTPEIESSQILSETRQIYRWSVRDRLVLDACLALGTNEPLCLDPSPMVHLVNNFSQSQIRSKEPVKRKNNHDRTQRRDDCALDDTNIQDSNFHNPILGKSL